MTTSATPERSAEEAGPTKVAAGSAADAPSFSQGLRRQRIVGNVIFPIIAPFLSFILYFIIRYRIRDRQRIRDEYRRIVRAHKSVLICPNHLTMVDSPIIEWALASNRFYARHFDKFPWNVPAIEHFGGSPLLRLLLYLTKCIPIDRKGSSGHREDVTRKLEWLLRIGEPVMIFAEGRRSLSGRIDREGAAYGPGLLIQRNPQTAVLCVYMRGDAQRQSSNAPVRGETFSIRMKVIQPTTEQKGLRGQRDLAEQILAALTELEAEHFAGL